MPVLDPQQQRQFAVEVVRQLRAAGFETYWAGGCVRDMLLDRVPKDYDVASGATPDEIRRLFGRRHTLALGAAFGVITVLGPKPAGAVEVATFRRDAAYSDGRHPDSVSFSNAEEDASRRDFTINGLFYDPLDQRVIDFVDGQADIRRRVIRAIGDARERFAEDKLRMLRAVRFATTLDFALDETTAEAIRAMPQGIDVVSAERIAAEMQRTLTGPNRGRAVRMLLETGLAATVLPEIMPAEIVQPHHTTAPRLDHAMAVLDGLSSPDFPLALAALLHSLIDVRSAAGLCRRWRLSNDQTKRFVWLLGHHEALRGATGMKWSQLQPLLVARGIGDLVALHEAKASAGCGELAEAAHCREMLRRPAAELDPPPLLTGDDLIGYGVPRGAIYRVLLAQVRDAQLDGRIGTTAEALALVKGILEETG
ncbi:MAG: CCA tRNA nucleotidyltransferase [Planctomycetes bacterium]|nr:CCA tRNA nucleotidyltransferase [Planctomycetota bacterium]